jgi:outer membrane autotransporter protein
MSWSEGAKSPSALRSLDIIRFHSLRMGVAAASGIVLFVSLGTSVANAQCATITPGIAPFPGWGPGASCAGASAGASIITAITTLNTAFLTQTSAFIGAPTDSQVYQLGGGVWVRGVGGRNTVESLTTAVELGGGSFTADSRSRLDFGGVEGGIDIGRFNLSASGANLYLGLVGGVISAGDSELTGVGRYNFTVPFAGIYTALTIGNFFVDAQFRGDFYDMDVSNALVGLSNETFHGEGATFTSSAGYKFNFGSFFVEPSLGVVWSRVSLNSLSTPGVLNTEPAGVYNFDTIDSVLGRVGVRLGTTVQSGNIAFQPFATASVWNEFAGNATSSFSPIGECPPGPNEACNPLDLSTSRIGTYGQYGVGLAAQVLNTGWLGYVRADYRSGDNIQGWDITGGLRYQFTLGEVPHPPLITK